MKNAEGCMSRESNVAEKATGSEPPELREAVEFRQMGSGVNGSHQLRKMYRIERKFCSKGTPGWGASELECASDG